MVFSSDWNLLNLNCFITKTYKWLEIVKTEFHRGEKINDLKQNTNDRDGINWLNRNSPNFSQNPAKTNLTKGLQT